MCLKSGLREFCGAQLLRHGLWVVAWLITALTLPGCLTYDADSLRKVAGLIDFAKPDLVSVRKHPYNPLTDTLQLLSRSGPEPSARTKQLLRGYDLEELAEDDLGEAIAGLDEIVLQEPTPENVYAMAELAYVYAERQSTNDSAAFDYYVVSVAQAYRYLFDPNFEIQRNPYDPSFRGACDLYNSSLEGALRIVHKRGQLRPGYTASVKSFGEQLDIAIVVQGPWHNEDFERFEFVSDYELKGLSNHHQTYGLGVPLIAVRKRHEGEDTAEQYYPDGLAFPVTAFVRVHPSRYISGTSQDKTHYCALELYDPLTIEEIEVAGKRTPLQSDISTPLAFFLNDPLLKTEALATFALLNAEFGEQFRGVYMLEPYDPEKVPVLMVHGLWSSPVTWMQMFNDLRAKEEIRDNFQFWFYLYPTGQPFWLSAKNMREDLAEVTRQLDPDRRTEALHQMVLVGHSMGGLVSRLQTLHSQDDFWRLVSDRSIHELSTDEESREELGSVLFFEPNPSVRRVITLGTPHRGSNFANSWTRWISHRLFRLPEMLTLSKKKVIRDNPDLFRDTELLSINTSIDSLSPESPFLPAMLKAQRASWVTYHNVVGRADNDGLLGTLGMKVAGEGDGVVSLASARMDDVESEVVVEADHVTVHQHPRSVLEVRRILLEHLDEIRTAQQQTWQVQQAGLFESGDSLRPNRGVFHSITDTTGLEASPPLPYSKQWPEPRAETGLHLRKHIVAPEKSRP